MRVDSLPVTRNVEVEIHIGSAYNVVERTSSHMDEKSLQMLEFIKIREILADFTAFAVSQEMALNLMPTSDRESISLLLRQSAEARRLLSLNPNFSIGGVRDVREAVEMAAREKVLDPHVLLDIRMTLTAASRLHSNLGKLSDEVPSLWSIAEQITALPHLEKEIGACIDDTGELLDSASAKLADLRQRLKETRQRLLHRLDSIIRSTSMHAMLQEPIVTEREGRYVVPIKVEFQGEFRGIVHDVSNSGATVFIEPFMAVEIGNNLRQLALEEKREIQRILAHLSAEVGSFHEIIVRNLHLIAELDLALTKARYAEKMKAAEPHVDLIGREDGANPAVLRIIDARHPLLRGEAVPLTVEIGTDFSGLIITGPNTGGKTVALKTIGLLTLMVQSGLPIPASEESCFPIFDSVFADIGDEQSIEQTLSTFSWHMGNIVRIIRMSTHNSLVLLDELGTSTDPSEGAALARAILLHFLARRTLVVATTHYGELKVFAHSTSGLQNASLEFDPVTLAPTYHLMVGIPGGSNALAIASRLGLPAEIIASAEEMLSAGTAEIETLLADLAREKYATRNLRDVLEKEKTEISNLKDALDHELRELKDQRHGILREARDTIAREAANLQKAIRQASSELRKKGANQSIEKARESLDLVREQLTSPMWQMKADTSEWSVEAGSIAVGDHVRLIDTNLTGVVIALGHKGSQIEIQAGQTKISVDVESVKKITPPEKNLTPSSYTVQRNPTRRRQLLELDLRGKRADEVESELDSYLNDTSLSGLREARIIHGYGTGVVRQIVRDMLVSHPLVKSFRSGEMDEGGGGVTIVEL